MRPEHTVADILEIEQLQLKSLSLTSWHYRALQAIRRCRTKAMGGHIDKCDCCHNLHISYNSCRNRHCPTCQGHKREEWIRAREDELLTFPIFTWCLPSPVNSIAMPLATAKSYTAVYSKPLGSLCNNLETTQST